MTLAVVVSSCNNYETYGDKKDKERNAISKYISDHGITVISEDQFNKQGHTTDVSKNEFVKFDRNGVYLQIVRQGCGSELEDGGRGTLVCRFAETNMFAPWCAVLRRPTCLPIRSRRITIPQDMPLRPTECSSLVRRACIALSS